MLVTLRIDAKDADASGFEPVKRDGKLVWSDVAGVRAKLAASGERILSQLEVKSVSREIAAT